MENGFRIHRFPWALSERQLTIDRCYEWAAQTRRGLATAFGVRPLGKQKIEFIIKTEESYG